MVSTSPEYKLGEIDAKLQAIKDGQEHMHDKLDSMDERLRSVEQKSALYGGLSGGIISVAVTLIIGKIKSLGI